MNRVSITGARYPGKDGGGSGSAELPSPTGRASQTGKRHGANRSVSISLPTRTQICDLGLRRAEDYLERCNPDLDDTVIQALSIRMKSRWIIKLLDIVDTSLPAEQVIRAA